jgi:hypothetical protein
LTSRDQLLVDVGGDFERPDEALALDVGVGDGEPSRGNPVGAGAQAGLVEGLEVGVEQFLAVATR